MRAKVKTCHVCDETKPLSEFYVHSSRGGLVKKRGACKRCIDKQTIKYREDPQNNERIRALGRERMRRLRSDPVKLKRLLAAAEERKKLSPRYSFISTIHNAKKYSKVFIDQNHLMELWKKQEGNCALTGIKMTWGRGGLKPTSISVDRIRHRDPYEKGNVRLICYCVNSFCQRMTDAEMVAMARAIVAKADAKKIRRMRLPRIHLVEDAA